MIDRYQVIYDIERCTCHAPDACRDCSLYNPDDGNLDCMERLLQNALTLIGLDTVQQLQEQKAVEPVYNEEKYGDHLPHCGNCEKVLPDKAVYGKVNFCHYCGRRVKRND